MGLSCSLLAALAVNTLPYIIRITLRYQKSESFSHVSLPQDSTEWGPGYIKYDPNGFLWLGGSHGIYRYYPDSKIIDQVPLLDLKLTGNYHNIQLIDYDSTGTLWVVDQIHGLYSLNRERDCLEPHHLELPELPNGINHISKCCMDRDGIIWILGELSQLLRFNPYTLSFRFVHLPLMESPPSNTSGGIAADSDGHIWFGLVPCGRKTGAPELSAV